MFRRMSARACAALCCLAPAFAQTPAPQKQQQPAEAAVSSEPSATSATFSDWVFRCAQAEADGRRRVCEIAQTLMMQGQTTPIALIAIGRAAPKNPARVVLVLPVNAAFEGAPQMRIEEQPSSTLTLAWKRCLPSGCFAEADIKPEVLALWRAAAKSGQIQYRNGGQQDVLLPFSFRGLAPALDALQKN